MPPPPQNPHPQTPLTTQSPQPTQTSTNNSISLQEETSTSSPGLSPSPFSIKPYTLGVSNQDQVYTVRPQTIWESLERKRSCTLPNSTTIPLLSDIHLHRPSHPHPSLWTARVLEIRASDAQHVYLRIFYYYTPQQLPSEIQLQFHSRIEDDYSVPSYTREYVASNEMEIVHADNVVGLAEIRHVDARLMRDTQLERGDAIWRYLYDVRSGELR